MSGCTLRQALWQNRSSTRCPPVMVPYPNPTAVPEGPQPAHTEEKVGPRHWEQGEGLVPGGPWEDWWGPWCWGCPHPHFACQALIPHRTTVGSENQRLICLKVSSHLRDVLHRDWALGILQPLASWYAKVSIKIIFQGNTSAWKAGLLLAFIYPSIHLFFYYKASCGEAYEAQVIVLSWKAANHFQKSQLTLHNFLHLSLQGRLSLEKKINNLNH